MIRYESICPHCRKPTVADADETGLELPLMQRLASKGVAHDICHERAIRRCRAGEMLERCCHKLIFNRDELSDNDMRAIRQMIVTACYAYADVTAEINGWPTAIGAEELAHDLMLRPHTLTQRMNAFRSLYRLPGQTSLAAINPQQQKLL